ncbi:MAG TPA: DNA adenine methylase [Archangium sp.]|uniref:DNA adenine methylase n=1 Tax=Archangium sp. TaxID=1872627 RepID=UPI002E377B52|nr:DNA adenine methylase [Archangium sp.]HEX5750036.1 DNA adenine methylase [Archangium sp.]
MSALRAPFPWFGGKSRAAPLVWQAFGDVANYVEPFAGSLAVLLARPTPPRVETVNDKDCYLANFWRAVQASPDEVAYWADSPVNEADLHATHRWLINGEDEAARLRKASNVALQALTSGDVAAAQAALRAGQLEGRPLGAALRERLRKDESYFDAEVAGRWVWGISQWIGSGWCAQPAWEEQDAAGAEKTCGIHTAEYEKRPALDKPGRGVHQLAARETGTYREGTFSYDWNVSLANSVNWTGGFRKGSSQGVHARCFRPRQQMPMLRGDSGAAGAGVHASGKKGTILEWMQALAARLRYVRVCCGDWKRVLTPSVTEAIGTTAVFLDPPYSAAAGRDPSIYAEEDLDVAHAVREWALANGDNPKLRIALCGYEGEHAMPGSWRCVAWKAPGGYAASAGNKANAQRERIWLSPHCQPARQSDLFSFAGATP